MAGGRDYRVLSLKQLLQSTATVVVGHVLCTRNRLATMVREIQAEVTSAKAQVIYIQIYI